MALQSSPPDAPLHDPTALAKYGSLDVVARLIVEGYMVGQHQSPFKGSSVEFVEHRQYYPGDEIRHIDWRAFGKTGKYYVKEFEEETNLRAYLLVDGSGSMAFGASTLSKFEYARSLAAALGYLLISQRDAVGLMTFDTKVRQQIEPATNPMNFRRMAQSLQDWKPGAETSLATVFEEMIPRLKRRSLVILISDFFDRIEPLTQALKMFQHARHEVILLQIVAPEEEEFPYSHPTQFRSLEKSSHRILVDPHRLRKEYLEQYHAFIENLTRTCGNAGVDYLKFTTDVPYHQALGAYLNSRARRKGAR